ncbi:MAG: hypothetical protein JSR59_07675 [Proteobacteria bacterium]|nr:hypothetical protein [Pseudomonadota bacterium]
MRKSTLLAAVAVAGSLIAGAAHAAVAVSVGIGLPRVGAVISTGPAYYPAYYPAPAYAPVYAPAYVAPPVVYRPSLPVYYGPRYYARPVVYPGYWHRGVYYRHPGWVRPLAPPVRRW